ncbi:hypothetical protein JOF53_005963 [Crossiella equi]|uniref:SalK n=1 Tax=Crossiella equi TaxID=130796 RepID=A0ABS5AKJ1_9PSEU|nr:hypothetical protein [Crossiella equi]MBP2477091.1 hypothetical protein [Crossiella equi]
MSQFRKLWLSLEAVHAFIYFVPEALNRFEKLGVGYAGGYFGSRAAAMGPVGAETVIATFYNFNPEFVRTTVPAVWDIASPEQFLATRLEAADEGLRRGLGEAFGSPAVAEVAKLARGAAERASELPHGRALFAAHAGLAWPEEPHLELWHAATLLREFRGDGHLAALLQENVSGLEALVLHGASGEVPPDKLRQTRQWSEEAWAASVEDLATRGLLTAEGGLTDAGRELRARVEANTDRMAAPAYDRMPDADQARLMELGAPLSAGFVAAGMVPAKKPAK